MKQYVFFSLIAIGAVLASGAGLRLYRGTSAGPKPQLIAEVRRSVVVEPVAAVEPIASSVPVPVKKAQKNALTRAAVKEAPVPETQNVTVTSEVPTNMESNPGAPDVQNIEKPASPPEPEPAPPPPPQPPPQLPVRVMISEILYDAAGSDVGKEFIEFYNSSDAAADLGGWSLSNDDKTLIKIGSGEGDSVSIPSRGFFLIGFNKYAGTADAVRSAALPNTSAALALKDKDGAAMDEVSYGGDLKVEKDSGASLERRVWEGAASFTAQPNPNPRNSQNTP